MLISFSFLFACNSLFQIFGFALVTEGIFLTYDKVFNHRLIKDILLSALSFDGLSFTHIRKSLCAFMFASGITLIITSGFGIFTPRTKSKCMHITVSIYDNHEVGKMEYPKYYTTMDTFNYDIQLQT